MARRDGAFDVVDSGRKTIHKIRQEHLPEAKVVKACSIFRPNESLHGAARPDHQRLALAASSSFQDAVEFVTRLYDEFGFDTVDNSPLNEF
jgi:predicted dinucleotide-binding enzyme